MIGFPSIDIEAGPGAWNYSSNALHERRTPNSLHLSQTTSLPPFYKAVVPSLLVVPVYCSCFKILPTS
jgi:hypothetical protein